MQEMPIEWTDYMRHRARMRNFDLAGIEQIVRHSVERYIDHATGRLVVVGRQDGQLVLIPYEIEQSVIRPVTVHATTRQQIDARIRSGRFGYE